MPEDTTKSASGLGWLWPLAIVLSQGIASATAPQEQPDYMQDPEYQKIAREWAEQMKGEYPEFTGFPTDLLETMGERLGEGLEGELAPAVQKYLGYKYGQAWESALPGYADMGVGPGTLASQKIRLGERQAIEGAYLGQQQISQAMEMMPQYTQMMLTPYAVELAEWQNVTNLVGQNFPGAPYTPPGATPTPTAPTAPTDTFDPYGYGQNQPSWYNWSPQTKAQKTY